MTSRGPKKSMSCVWKRAGTIQDELLVPEPQAKVEVTFIAYGIQCCNETKNSMKDGTTPMPSLFGSLRRTWVGRGALQYFANSVSNFWERHLSSSIPTSSIPTVFSHFVCLVTRWQRTSNTKLEQLGRIESNIEQQALTGHGKFNSHLFRMGLDRLTLVYIVRQTSYCLCLSAFHKRTVHYKLPQTHSLRFHT